MKLNEFLYVHNINSHVYDVFINPSLQKEYLLIMHDYDRAEVKLDIIKIKLEDFFYLHQPIGIYSVDVSNELIDEYNLIMKNTSNSEVYIPNPPRLPPISKIFDETFDMERFNEIKAQFKFIENTFLKKCYNSYDFDALKEILNTLYTLTNKLRGN